MTLAGQNFTPEWFILSTDAVFGKAMKRELGPER